MSSLPVTGERFIPGKMNDPATITEHYQRYSAALPLVKGKVVLDIASGSGYGTYLLSSAAAMAYGVEIDRNAVEYSRERYAGSNLKYLQGSVDRIPLEDHSVDVVVSFETIEHVGAELQIRMMEEIERVLKADGILFISSPDKRYYSEERGFDNPYHVHELYASEFKALLEKHFSRIAFAGQRFLFGCCAIWNDRIAGNTVLYDDLAKTQSEELGKPHYLLAVAGNGPLPEVFNSIVEYTPDAAFREELQRRPDPVELFIADQAEQWRPAAVSTRRKESSGSRTELEMDFTCGALPCLRIDLGYSGFQYRLEMMQAVRENEPAADLLKSDFGSTANAFIEFEPNGPEKIPVVIPYTDDPQLLFELPSGFAGKECRLTLRFSTEAVVISGIVARKIAELNSELARYRGGASKLINKLYGCSEKLFPGGSRRRRFLSSVRVSFKK